MAARAVLVIDAIGAAGAAYSVWNKRTGRVEWLSMSGPLVAAGADHISHYYARDPYRTLLDAAAVGRLVQVTACLPETVLRRSEWYNDFIVKSGIDDMLGMRICESRFHRVFFGIHHGIDQRPLPAEHIAALQELVKPLSKAARLHVELCTLGWTSAIAPRALDQLAAGMIVAEGDGRVIEMNQTAECIVRRGDSLTLWRGKLGARHEVEQETLARFTVAKTKTAEAIERMARPTAQLRRDRGAAWPRTRDVWTPSCHGPGCRPRRAFSLSERDLAKLFNLSPGEARLALALLSGKRPISASRSRRCGPSLARSYEKWAWNGRPTS
jgi:hypothetical protein